MPYRCHNFPRQGHNLGLEDFRCEKLLSTVNSQLEFFIMTHLQFSPPLQVFCFQKWLITNTRNRFSVKAATEMENHHNPTPDMAD